LIAWINDRDAREKALLAGAAVILLLAGLWVLVWDPLDDRLSEFQARVTQQQAIYLQLQQLAAEAEQLGSGSASVADRGDQSLMSLADRSVRAAGLAGALRRIEPAGEGRVRLWLQQAQFDPMAKWLQSLSREYGIHVFAASIDRGDSTGLVIAEITLEDAP
jgi:general secretion pathway protein M